MMSFNKSSTIEHYWSNDGFIGNYSIQDIIARSRFKEILRNLHFLDNSSDDKNDLVSKLTPLIDYFDIVYQTELANSEA